MNKNFKPIAIATTSAAALLAVMVGIPVYLDRTAEGSCYVDLAAYKTWDKVKPLVDEALEDRFLTRAECDTFEEAYNEAKTEETRLQKIAEYYGPVQAR